MLDVVGTSLRFGERPCFVLCLNFSLMLWTTDQDRHLQLPHHTWRCGIFSYHTVGEADVEQYPTTPLSSAVSGHLLSSESQLAGLERLLKDVTVQCRGCETAATFYQSLCFSILDKSAFLTLPHTWKHLTDILPSMFQLWVLCALETWWRCPQQGVLSCVQLGGLAAQIWLRWLSFK